MKQDISYNVLALSTDQGCEFCNVLFDNFLDDNHIAHQTSTIYTQQQNGYIE